MADTVPYPFTPESLSLMTCTRALENHFSNK